jgi:uncharacterized protein
MRKALKILGDGITALLVFLIFVYQRAISPYTTPSCGYTPTCSNYMKGALRKYGPLKGLWLGIKRIFRCHPFHEGGYDPVP